MNRREALVTLSALLGGTVFGAQRLLADVVNPATAGRALTAAQLAYLNEVAETIVPTTPGSPGAKAAGVAAFMQEIVRDFYDEKEFATFTTGPERLEEASRAMFSSRGYLDLLPGERFTLLMSLEKAQPQPDYYKMIKQLAVWGYFSSEIGMTQALAHVAVPGRYEADVTIGPRTKAWSQ